MYLAELHGKFSPRTERMEDILTSNVFSFFKYSSRDIFFKSYLDALGFDVSAKEAEEAEFKFWPRFEDGTEPDLVIIVGKYYILFEAKYYSGFGEKTETTDKQLIREIRNGQLDAKNYKKEFKLFAITADYYYKKNKFETIPRKFRSHIRWTNWQSVSSVLDNVLERNLNVRREEQAFVSDLCKLLDKKNLRGFHELTYNNADLLKYFNAIFFDAKTAKLRGDFIGFVKTLSLTEGLKLARKIVFYSSNKRIFKSLLKLEKVKKAKSPIFFKKGEINE